MDAKKASEVNKIYNILCEKKLDQFHLWDPEAQGDMCVRIQHRLSVKGLLVNVINVVDDFEKIMED